MILGRTAPTEVHEGFMASNDDVETLVRGFWQNDAPMEQRVDLSTWLPMPFATSLDHFMVELASDLHTVATMPSATLPLQLRVPTLKRATALSGIHWFTVAYSLTRSASMATTSCEDAFGVHLYHEPPLRRCST